jgi:hypothetical protein
MKAAEPGYSDRFRTLERNFMSEHIIGDMLSRRARLTAMFLLLICLLCPISESLDVWHATLEGGNDTEFALVIAALSAGVGYITARLMFKSKFAASVFSSVFAQYPEQFFSCVAGFQAFRFPATGPPLLPLRI